MSQRPRLILMLLSLTVLLLSGVAQATGNTVEKFALVIGNPSYREKPLPNAQHDAELMAQSLKRLGFTVTERANLTRSQFLAEVAAFTERLPEGSTAVVYYAGHGMQVGGSNYLTPVDMELTSEQTVPLKAYPLKTLLERLSSSRSAVNVVILDACRNNPFQPQGPVRYRNFNDLGLASVQAPRGTLVAFSTAPGQLAADGRESNSIYTAALARVIGEPRLELREIFDKVASQVRRKTLDDQIPWYETSLTERYYFLPPEGVSVVAGKSMQVADAGRRDGGVRRGLDGPALERPLFWFDTLSPNEWSQLDWEIKQRARRLTADELPALEHKGSGGNLVAQTTLGLAYRDGIEKATEPATGKTMRYNANNTKALKWLRKAAEAGFPIAQVELGEMHYAGHGVDRDLNESRRWLEQAASVNYPRAKLDLLQLNAEAKGQGVSFKEIFNLTKE